ncbi:MAG: hypothetical protein M1834_007663 [Cirrosporium novae-zelandiae]|nr:MAG: hypothetical protein M1834_007663 [Cirrosporium novae-zelandiae]
MSAQNQQKHSLQFVNISAEDFENPESQQNCYSRPQQNLKSQHHRYNQPQQNLNQQTHRDTKQQLDQALYHWQSPSESLAARQLTTTAAQDSRQSPPPSILPSEILEQRDILALRRVAQAAISLAREGNATIRAVGQYQESNGILRAHPQIPHFLPPSLARKLRTSTTTSRTI